MRWVVYLNIIQDGSNMTGTDLCVNKCKQSRSYLNHLVLRSLQAGYIWIIINFAKRTTPLNYLVLFYDFKIISIGPVAYAGILFGGGEFNKFRRGQRTVKTGI